MSKRLIVYVAILLTIINLTILGVIIYNHWLVPEEEKQINNFERIKQEVGLTPVQLEKINEFRRSFHTELDSLEILLMDERQQLVKEIRAAEPDTTEMRRIINRIGTIQQEVQHLIIRQFISIREILNLEQQDRFFDIVLEEFKSNRQFPSSEQRHQSPGSL